MTLMVVMTSQVYTYPQTHQVIHIRYVQPFVCQSHLKNSGLKKKKSLPDRVIRNGTKSTHSSNNNLLGDVCVPGTGPDLLTAVLQCQGGGRPQRPHALTRCSLMRRSRAALNISVWRCFE